MREEYRESLGMLFADNTKKEQVDRESQIIGHEEMRSSIEVVARRIYESYLEEYKKLEPEATGAFDVIREWFMKDIIEGGFYQRIFEWKPNFVLNDPIEFSWPYLAIKEIRDTEQTETRPFQSFMAVATIPFAPGGPGWRIKEKIEQLQNQKWEAEYRLKNYRFDTGLYIWVDAPRKEKPIWRVPIYSEIDFGVTQTEAEDLLPNLHPVVLTEFAKQIKSNQVWERIEGAMRSS